jgi:hypothetical protein
MQLLEYRKSQALPWSVLLALLFFCSGCQTTKESLFTVSGPGWHVREGQALWKPGHKYPELGGDLVLANNDDGRCLIEFEKTPITMVSAQITPESWLIRFPQRQMGFSGHGKPSTRFLWLYLPAALSGKKLPKNLGFERKPDGGWRLENSRSGETLEGFLGP